MQVLTCLIKLIQVLFTILAIARFNLAYVAQGGNEYNKPFNYYYH